MERPHYWYHPEDHEALSDGILHILSSEALSKSLGANALEKVTNEYSLDRMVEDYKSLYLSVFR